MTIATAVALAIVCQAFGAIIGTGATVWGEIAYLNATRDGQIDRAERLHLNMIARGLRFGLTLLLLASLALVVLAFVAHVSIQPAMTPAYWTLVLLTLLLIYTGWARSRKRISFPLGSAIIFSAWWFVLYLTFGQLPGLSIGAAIAFFIVATAVFYGVLQYARILTVSPRR